MIIERDIGISTTDPCIVLADVFHPRDGKPAPVIMTLGPYGKAARYKHGFVLSGNG
jgi:predicted acyl esterase